MVGWNASPSEVENVMTILNIWPSGNVISIPEPANNPLDDRAPDDSHGSTVIAHAAPREQKARSTRILAGLHRLAESQSSRLAIKVRGKILFIRLGDVLSVQAEAKCVRLQLKANSYLLRESISGVAARLETHGFIRIHRSVIVNVSFVEEIGPLSTGEYCLRVEGGKEYTVSRTYKKNLKSLADVWIGTSPFLSA